MSVRTASEVKLVASSREIVRWKSYEIESDLLTAADAFHFVASNANGALAGVVSPEDEVRVLVDGVLVLVGVVDEVRYDGSGDGSTVTITGRDRGRWLTDCSPLPYSLKNQTLLTLARKLTEPWIKQWSAQARVGALPPVKKAKVELGESIIEALQRFARPARLLVWLDEQGRGVVGRPNYNQKPLYSLYRYVSDPLRGKNNVLSGSVVRSSRSQFSAVTVLSSVANTGRGLFSAKASIFGTGASKLKGTATDSTVTTHKPRIHSGQAANSSQARTLAQEEVDRGRWEGWVGTYTVPGHYNSDELWRTDTLCTLVDELAGVSGGTYYVSRRRFTGGEQGRYTEVEIHQAGVFYA